MQASVAICNNSSADPDYLIRRGRCIAEQTQVVSTKVLTFQIEGSGLAPLVPTSVHVINYRGHV